jgi:limonene 1,2-monooxygenase
MLEQKMKFGAFMPPVHGIKENPTLAIERDLQLVEWMDELGYDEVWMGEHHSAGAELVGSPEVFISAAAQRTKRIKLGTGVVTVPYQHPFILADRMNQLDHMTRGRTIFGMGPGALVADAYMQGLKAEVLRDRMDESVDVIVRLMRGETVTEKTDWFECVDARLQTRPYSRPSIEMATANNVSPTGAKAAGRHGLSMLSLGATTHKGFNALAANWNIVEESAAEHGQTVDRANWRLVGPMHIAETREQAMEEVRFGIGDWVKYYTEVANIPIVEKGVDPLKAVMDTGMAVIGTPDDAIERIQSLKESSGGFGTYLFMDVNWANFANKKKHYEMFARYVMPEFQQMNDARVESQNWVKANVETFTAGARAAVGSRIMQHLEEKGAENLNPEMIKLMQQHQQGKN